MPELPEVEVLVRHLGPLLKGRTIRGVEVRRPKVIAPTAGRALTSALCGATFAALARRGKYLLFTIHPPHRAKPFLLVGHLGMTGRIYLAPSRAELPRHAAVVLDLGKHNFIYEDTRYFGRLTLDDRALAKLGPEPLGVEFTAAYLAGALKRSRQAIKVKLLDQSLVAGVGNIYASEALYRARISPRVRSNRLSADQVRRLRRAVREILTTAIRLGSTLPLNFAGDTARDGLFYFGSDGSESRYYAERLLVYDRQGKPCPRCGREIRRFVQAARSTFYCPNCQPA